MPLKIDTVAFRLSAHKAIKKMIDKVTDVKPALKEMSIYLDGQYQIVFRDQGRGKKWPPRMVPNLAGIISDLSRGQTIKPRRFSSRPALSDTGRLAKSGSTRIEGTVIYWGTNIPYARIHQEGGTTEITSKVPDMVPDKRISQELKKLTKKGFPELAARILITKRFRITVPKRTFLEIIPKDREMFIKILQAHIEREK